MSRLWIIHPDTEIAKELQATIAQAWPEIVTTIHAPNSVPEPMPQDCAVLSDQPYPRGILLSPDPQRFKKIVQRLHVVLRSAYSPAELHLQGCVLNTRNRQWTGANGGLVMLTEKEVDLLVYLWQCACAATRDDLLKEVWEYAPGVDTHTIETHIYRLRQKIETDPGNPQILITGKDGYQLSATIPS